jgi:hypothetical protein
MLHSGNYTSYAPSLTGSGASGTWAINISGTAAAASSVAWGNVTSKPSYIMYYQGFTLDANSMDTNATGFTYASGAPYTGPIARFSAGGSYDLQLNASYSGNGAAIAYRTRNGDAGTWNSWWQFITTANISGQSVAYATNAGYAEGANNAALAANASGVSFQTQNNPTWGARIQLGGNGDPGTAANVAVVQATDGNIHIDNGTGKEMYLNYYRNGKIYLNGGTYYISANGSFYNGTASAANYLNSAGYIYRGAFSGNWNVDFQNTPAGSFRYYGDNAADANSPGGTWWFSESYRHSNASNYWGIQVAWGWEDNQNRLATRNVSANSFGGWVYYLNSSNFTSYLNAPNAVGNPNGYYNVNNWLQMNGTHGMFWPSYYGFHIRPNITSTYTQMEIIGSKNSYGGIWDNYSAVAGIMYDSNGNGGVYREASSRWYWYHLVANNCMGVNTSTTSASYGLYVAGAIYSNDNICAYSDARKKENVVTVENALEKVLKLRGVNYNRIDDETKTRKIGVIAQETELVLPEVVTYAEDVDEYSVMYGNMSGLFIEAFKEQQAEIQQLKELVNQLLSK